MPTRPKRPCCHPGCGQLTDGRFCEAHREREPKPLSWRTTSGSSTSRGYGAAWRRLRKMIIARDPFCVLCGKHPTEHVDHIVPKASGGDDSEANLRGLCESCHMRKTAQDGHQRKAQKRLANTIRRRAASPRR